MAAAAKKSGGGATKRGEQQSMNIFDRVILARRIGELRAENPPVTWPKVSARLGYPQRTCQLLHAQLQEHGDPDRPFSATDALSDHINIVTQAMRDAAQAAIDAPAGSNAQVGALRNLVDFSERRIDMMRAAGWIPRQLGALSAEREMQQMFREFAELLRRYDVSDDLLHDMLKLGEARFGYESPGEQRGLTA